MEYSNKSIAAGIITAAVLAGFAALERAQFLELETRGTVLFVVTLLLAAISGIAVSVWPSADRKWYPVWRAAVFFMAPMAAVAAVERLNGNYLSDLHATGWMWVDNYCVALLFFLLVYALSGSVRIPVFLLNPALLAFGIANMYVKEFKGGPLVPMDVGSIATAASVASGYTYTIGAEICYAVTVTVCIMALACHLRRQKTGWLAARRKLFRLAALAVVIAAAVSFYATEFWIGQGYKPDFFNQTRGYKAKGAILEFMVNTRYMRLSKPADYDADRVQADVEAAIEDAEQLQPPQTATDAKAGTGKRPNIIVIMNETFADLKVLGDFETNTDYMPFIHSLEENTIKGNAYVSVLGTGTSNTEFEFLTGNTMAFLPAGSNAYQLYVKGEQPGLVSTLEAQGYKTAAFHPYFKGNWNRKKVYRLMGFDRYRGLENMFPKPIIKRYQERMNARTFAGDLKEEYGRDDILLRQYISDSYDYEDVIAQWEARNKKKPFFLFNVTMQNHSPYDQYLNGMQHIIKLKGLRGRYPLAEQYLSLIHYSDQAFQELVEYFQGEEEPVLILFFGDHQPYVESEFCSEIMGEDVTEAEGAALQRRYVSQMVLWANYDIPEGSVDKISINYLQSLLLETAGLAMPEYQQYLAGLRQKIPVITAMGAEDASGTYFRVDEENAYEEELSVYQNAAYNNLSDRKNRVDELFQLKKTE